MDRRESQDRVLSTMVWIDCLDVPGAGVGTRVHLVSMMGLARDAGCFGMWGDYLAMQLQAVYFNSLPNDNRLSVTNKEETVCEQFG